MSEGLKVFLAILLFGLLPTWGLYAIVEAYGRRRRWESRRLWQWVVIIGAGWTGISGILFFDLPLRTVAGITALLFIAAWLYVSGLQGWAGHFRRKRSDSEQK
jgi:hypothetical protein